MYMIMNYGLIEYNFLLQPICSHNEQQIWISSLQGIEDSQS